jgi:hypothetical protein
MKKKLSFSIFSNADMEDFLFFIHLSFNISYFFFYYQKDYVSIFKKWCLQEDIQKGKKNLSAENLNESKN